MTTPQTPFKKWYEANKAALSVKRSKRYHSDPEYRARIQARRSKEAEARKAALSARGCSVTEACDAMGVTAWTLNRWKNAGYLPIPTLRSFRFSDHQMQLLGLLKQFFTEHPRRNLAQHKDKLDALVAVIHHNWNG